MVEDLSLLGRSMDDWIIGSPSEMTKILVIELPTSIIPLPPKNNNTCIQAPVSLLHYTEGLGYKFSFSFLHTKLRIWTPRCCNLSRKNGVGTQFLTFKIWYSSHDSPKIMISMNIIEYLSHVKWNFNYLDSDFPHTPFCLLVFNRKAGELCLYLHNPGII